MKINHVNYFLGVFWFIASLFISSLNDVLTKYLGSSNNPYEVVFFRYFFGTLTLLPFMMYYGKRTFVTSRPMVHVLRGCLLFGGIALWCHALNVVTVTAATVINFTIPLFVLIFARIPIILVQSIIGNLLRYFHLFLIMPIYAHLFLFSQITSIIYI